MKKLIDLTPDEINHRIEWFEFYKIMANLMFVLLILGAFYMSLIGGEPERLKYQMQCERDAFREHAKSEFTKIDTLQWYREIMGK